MRTIPSFLLIFSSTVVFAQIKFPVGFTLVKGENGSGADDYYTNGRYFFDTHNAFADYSYKNNDDSVKNYLSKFFGFPFHLTKDGLCWGTGKKGGFYSYIIITAVGGDIELYSKYNDQGFSDYSAWLLSTVREYKKKGKNASFPLNTHAAKN